MSCKSFRNWDEESDNRWPTSENNNPLSTSANTVFQDMNVPSGFDIVKDNHITAHETGVELIENISTNCDSMKNVNFRPEECRVCVRNDCDIRVTLTENCGDTSVSTGKSKKRSPYPWRQSRRRKMIRLMAMILVTLLSFISIKVYYSFIKGQDLESAQPTTTDGHRKKRFVNPSNRFNGTVHCIPVVYHSHGLPPDFLTKSEGEKGGWVIHLAIGIYMFAAVESVCDLYFVPALEHISEDLDLQSDVAGATFMAAASSAPEFCTTIIGVFLAKNDVGLGTILGSSIFNLLCIIGACAIFAGMPVQLTWYPLTRDTIFYVLSVALMAFSMSDSLISWYEALVMVIAYFFYIVTMVFNKKLEKWCTDLMLAHEELDEETKSGMTDSMDSSRSRLSMMEARSFSRIANQKEIFLTKSALREIERLGLNPADFTVKNYPRGLSLTEVGVRLLEEKMRARKLILDGTSTDPDDARNRDMDNAEDEEKQSKAQEQLVLDRLKKDKIVVSTYENPLKFPKSFWARCYWIFILPVTILHAFTIPDSRLVGKWQGKVYLLSFALSVLYIGVYSYIMVWMISLAGSIWKIPNTITGLTVIAAGTSVPDLLSSIFVARDGYGDMAVSNAIGSNIFDILVCLGVPWLIDSLFLTKEGTPISSDGMTFMVMTLILTIVYLWGSMKCFHWTLTPIYGFITIFLYLVVTVFCILIEANIIFQTNEHRYC